jgi:cytochrome c biogenesis DsbD-like protein
MWFIWGDVQGEKELGVVAEQCPYCDRLAPCYVTARVQGLHVYFITLAETATDAGCRCGACGGQFRRELWQFKEFVPPVEAHTLPLEVLLQRTNPLLAERLEWKRVQEEFAADPLFLPALQSAEQLRLGPLRTRLMKELRQWDRLEEKRRTDLAHTAHEAARALRFLQSRAGQLPGSAGCLWGLLVCVSVWSAFLWAPAVRTLLGGALTVFAGLVAGTGVLQLLDSRRVKQWTREVFIPEGEKEGIDFGQLVAVLDDLPPPSPHGHDELHRWREHAGEVLEELAASGKGKGIPGRSASKG